MRGFWSGVNSNCYRDFLVSLALYYAAFASSGALFVLTGWYDRFLNFLLFSLLLAASLLALAGSIGRLAGSEGAETRHLLLAGLEVPPSY